MKKFLIVDGNSIMNRAFYGLSPRVNMTANGIYTNALYGFLNIYWMIENKINPDYVAVSFDLHKPTFRHLMYKEYKGTRKGMPEELKPQMDVIKEILASLNILILQKETYEADDILGTVSRINEENDIATYILTGDRDSYQLISKSTYIIMPSSKMGKTDYAIYDEELLKEKYNIAPYQVVDVKSLMGDSSDNIPGVKGVGEKTAYSLIDKYTTLVNIYNNIDNLDASAKVKEKLINDKEMAFLSYDLAKIDRNVPITFTYEEASKKEPNLVELYKIFKKLNFNKFMARYDFSNVNNENIEESSDINNCLDNEICISKDNIEKINDLVNNCNFKYITDINEFKDILSNNLVISYYLNINNHKHFEANILSKSYNIDKDFLAIFANDVVYIVDFSNKDKIEYLSFFASSNVIKYGFNIKQDLRYLFDNNISNVVNFKYDLCIAVYLLDLFKGKFDIFNVVSKLVNLEFKVDDDLKQLSLFDLDSENISYTSDFDDSDKFNICLYLFTIFFTYNDVIAKLTKLDMLNLFNNIEMPLSETLANMEHNGMYIDKEKLNEFDVLISDKLVNLEKEIYDIAGTEFNINSPKQLASILFDKLQLPVIRKNKSGASTDKEVLEELYDKHEIIKYILDYRTVAKLKSTYVDGLRDKIEADNRIHTTFMQTLTSTGRLSSTEPNLQNIPVRLELGSKIRSFFVGSNDNILLDADYSQIELRVLSHMSNDSTMIDAFINNKDIHASTAKEVFNLESIDDVTKDLRSKAKAVNFGIVYGISEFGLAKDLNISRKDASLFINNYLEKYPSIKLFLDTLIKEAKLNGFSTTLYNRRRYIDELKSSNKNIIKFGERIAMNTPVQGTAADIIKIAMNNIYNKLKFNNLKSKLIMQVHDELIIETFKDEEDIVKNILKTEMENAATLKVPLKVDINMGKSWLDAK